MTRYAESTSVSSENSRAEIEVRFTLPMPDAQDRRFTHTPTRGTLRSAQESAKAYEQAVRQSWRALSLVIKAKLEAVDAGIVQFETEFLPHFVMPDGRTVAQHVEPKVAVALETGVVTDLLPKAIEA